MDELALNWCNSWSIRLSVFARLQPGVYYVQFLVDGAWMSSPDLPVGPDEDGHFCNKVRTRTHP